MTLRSLVFIGDLKVFLHSTNVQPPLFDRILYLDNLFSASRTFSGSLSEKVEPYSSLIYCMNDVIASI